jgi:hypothetical protein
VAKKRKGRRACGAGSIFFHEGRQRWVGRRVAGRTPEGKPLYAERWGETQAEVIVKLEAAGRPDPNTLTVASWANQWRPTLAVRASTKHDYLNSIDRHVLPALGGLKLAAVTTTHVEALIAKLAATHEQTTVAKILRHTRILFADANRADLIPKNVVAVARKPRQVPRPTTRPAG